jgi:glycosyltransferase involved in cell wall biosynthesis
MKMAQAFKQEGHSVELLAPLGHEGRPLVDDDLWHHYGIRSPFPIVWMHASNFLGKRAYQVRAVLYALRADAELIYTRNLAAAALSSGLNVPTCYEAHDLPGGRMGPLYFRTFLAGRGCLRLVIISRALRRLLYRRFPTLLDKDVVVAPDGVDLDRFDSLPTASDAKFRIGLNQERFVAGYTGHLYAGRGINLILCLAQRCNQIDFLVVGGALSSVERFKREAQQRSLTNIRFVGFVHNADLPIYQAACDVLLMPYQNLVANSGGGDIASVMSPMKMFEYMATGRLVISSNLPVLREILSARNSLLCDPENVTEWQNALQWAAANVAERLALGQRARKDAEQYSWRRRVERVLEGSTV